MPLPILGLAVILQAVFIHGLGRIFFGREVDSYYGMAAFAGLATFIVFNKRDGLPWWPALPLLLVIGVLAHWLSVKAHRRFSR